MKIQCTSNGNENRNIQQTTTKWSTSECMYSSFSLSLLFYHAKLVSISIKYIIQIHFSHLFFVVVKFMFFSRRTAIMLYYARCCADLKVISMFFLFYELTIQQTNKQTERQTDRKNTHSFVHTHTHTHTPTPIYTNRTESNKNNNKNALNEHSRWNRISASFSFQQTNKWI